MGARDLAPGTHDPLCSGLRIVQKVLIRQQILVRERGDWFLYRHGGPQQKTLGFLAVVSKGIGRVDESRSEEHTSELQSLMRISYAVFCLKKKNKKTQYNTPRLKQ